MRRWEDNIKMGLNETGCEGLEWMNLAHHRDIGCCEHGNEPSDFINYGKILDEMRNF